MYNKGGRAIGDERSRGGILWIGEKPRAKMTTTVRNAE